MNGCGQACEGVKVVEFAAYAAGPVVGKHLGDHGATVVHVESRGRPDGFRMQYPPYTDNQPGVNRSGTFALCNNNKYSVTMDLKTAGGLELARRAVAWADVVIENFTPGTMKRLGLGYEELSEINPSLVMLSSCNQGQTGPHAKHPGFGSQLTSLSGFTHLTGHPDGDPCLLYGPYIDFIGVGYGLIAVLAALDYRKRTGRGTHIDLAQYEAGLQFMAPVVLDYSANGHVMERMGNRNPAAAPHGVYPCAGEDRWCAVSVSSADEWRLLRLAMGDPAWAADPRYDTLEGRKADEDEIDERLGIWTRDFEPAVLMALLQARGVRAGVVNRVQDLYADPQYAHRGIWQALEHPEMGTFHYQSPPFLLSETPAALDRPSPCLGEHNERFFVEILGVARDEYESLVGEGVC
ncbi:MAG: CaiB/BaiF CoA transferase family protein [Thermoleophilia bacterium]